MILSLGSDCCMRTRLNEFIYKENKQISQAFDWVISDIFSIINALEYYENDINVFSNKFLKIECKTQENMYCVSNKFINFISLHDANGNLDEEAAKLHIEQKYTRRLQRFIDVIKNNNHIAFIGVFDEENCVQKGQMNLDDNIIKKFVSCINKINPINNFKYIFITNNTSSISNNANINIIDSNKYIIDNKINNDWYRYYYDWDRIFNDLSLKQYI